MAIANILSNGDCNGHNDLLALLERCGEAMSAGPGLRTERRLIDIGTEGFGIVSHLLHCRTFSMG